MTFFGSFFGQTKNELYNNFVNHFKLLGIRIDNHDETKIEEIFDDFLASKKFNHIATVNPEFLVEANKNTSFKNILNGTELNICDGSGISIWSKLLYKKSIQRIPGVHIAELLCKTTAKNNKTVYFLGGFGVAKEAAKVMKKKYTNLKVAGFEDGDPKSISKKLKEANPDVILVAFGAPAQEEWIKTFITEIPNCRIAGGFGGTFDFWAGKIDRAPFWMQKIGIEWLFRLLKEPKKRGNRIFNAVIVFSYLIVKEKFSKK